jgi:hypothetical protein
MKVKQLVAQDRGKVDRTDMFGILHKTHWCKEVVPIASSKIGHWNSEQLLKHLQDCKPPCVPVVSGDEDLALFWNDYIRKKCLSVSLDIDSDGTAARFVCGSCIGSFPVYRYAATNTTNITKWKNHKCSSDATEEQVSDAADEPSRLSTRTEMDIVKQLDTKGVYLCPSTGSVKCSYYSDFLYIVTATGGLDHNLQQHVDSKGHASNMKRGMGSIFKYMMYPVFVLLD